MTVSIIFIDVEDDDRPGNELVTKTRILDCEKMEGTMQRTWFLEMKVVETAQPAIFGCKGNRVLLAPHCFETNIHVR
jgi:hypothetical protein